MTRELEVIDRDLIGLRGEFAALNRSLTLYGQTRPWNMPWGLVVSTSSTSDQTLIGAAFSDITFATASWTGQANRQYRITCIILPLQVTAPGSHTFSLQTGTSGAGTNLAQTGTPSVAVGSGGTGNLVAFRIGTGTLSIHARIATSGGTITVSNSSITGQLIVEDIGSYGPPA